MTNSILDTIKEMLPIALDDDSFDMDIIVNINGVFATLGDLGAGNPAFMISDNSTTWSDYSTNDALVNKIKMYMYAKVKLAFDPPSNSSYTEALKHMRDEQEWRILNHRD